MASTKVKVLACAMVHCEPHLFEAHLKQLRAQILPSGVQLNLSYILDADDILLRQLRQLCAKYKAEIAVPAVQHPKEAEYGVDETSHHWTTATFDWLAIHKQQLIDKAQKEGYTHIWFVDSDLLLEPSTLKSLLSTKKDIISAVFWTHWNGADSGSLGPNVWLRHPYMMEGLGIAPNAFFTKLVERRVTRVLGGGACYLINLSAIKDTQIRYHPRLPLPNDGSMWQGEDRSFAVLCERSHTYQYADPWPDIWHCYHPAQRTPEFVEKAMETLNFPRQEKAEVGDLINFTIEALEEPRLLISDAPKPRPFVLCIRGRLGAMKLLPELEAALYDLKVGSEAIIALRFPSWYPIAEYRDQTRAVRVALVDVKSYGFAPVVAERAYLGIDANSNKGRALAGVP